MEVSVKATVWFTAGAAVDTVKATDGADEADGPDEVDPPPPPPQPRRANIPTTIIVRNGMFFFDIVDLL